MNKRIFTLLTAGLLLGGPAFNAAYAAGAKTVVEYTNNKTALANGTQFFLGTSNSTAYKVGSVLTTKDKKKVVSIDLTTTVNPTSATVFEIRSYSSRTFELWAKVGDEFYQVITKTDGTTVGSSDASSTELSKFNTSFVVKDGKLNFTGLFTVALPSSQVGQNLKAYSYSTEYTAEDLNEYNSKSTTLSFNYTTSELVGNLFENVIPVDVPVVTGTSENIEQGTYFVKGDAKKVNAFKAELAASPMNADAVIAKAKDITFLAVDPSNRYDINGKQDNEGYALYWMKGEKLVANADSCGNANFSITAKDVLNEDGALTLTVDYTKKDASAPATVYVAAVKPSVSDTKTYVTTVLQTNSNYSPIHPQLGANTYLDASVLLKKNAENVVNVYFTSASKSENDDPADQTEYHKYLTIDPEDGSNLKVVAYNSADFTMPVSQWIVSNFDGKYTFTLTNRETADDLVLKLQPEGSEGGYEVINAQYNSSPATIAAGKGVTNVLSLAGTSVKFNTIATTRTDGSVVFTDIQIEEGVKLTFNGKDALFGNKALYAIVKSNAMVASASLDNGEKEIVLYPERVAGSKTHTTESLREVEDYVINKYTYVYLNDKGEVVRAADKDTLVVPTYILRTTEVKGDNARYLSVAYVTNAVKASAAEFAIVKNAAGGYSLVTVKSTADGTADYNAAITAGYAYVNTTSMAVAANSAHYATAVDLNKQYANVVIADANPFNPSLAAKPRHASFDNILGSINYQLNKNGINEGILSAESMIFWLDTANSADKTPAFYISKGAEVAEGEEQPAERMFMFNANDSLHYFVEGSAQEYLDRNYYLEGTTDTKVIFRPAILTGVDTLSTTVNGKVVEVAPVTKADGTIDTKAVDNFKFHITLVDGSDDKYVIQSKNGKDYVYALNGKLGLTGNADIAMVFTLGTEVPTSNESIDAAESSIVVVAGNGVVTIQGAAGETAYVRTVLGQTIAETVLTSDNATIAAPAGVVFVTVGNETVKVAVK
ncbi:DUF6383 domain-containing protein [Parabacteroides sp.]